MISKFPALPLKPFCKMILPGVSLTVSRSTQQKVKFSILEATMSLNIFCLGPNSFRLSIRSNVWVSWYLCSLLSKPHVESKLPKCNRIFSFSKQSVPFCVSRKKSLLYKALISLFSFTAPLPGLFR